MGDDLTERLKSHARSFDSLLSLIPAKHYYSEDVSDQWKRKKQTPEQKRAAKIAKLDPDNWKSAKDVMDERAAAAALKRKRGTEDDEDDRDESQPSLHGDSDIEQPKALLESRQPNSKKRKLDREGESAQHAEETPEDKRRRKAEERAAKRERKKEKRAKAKEKLQRQKAKKRETQDQVDKKEVKELHLQVPVDLPSAATESTVQKQGQDQDSPRAASPSTAASDEEPEEVFSPHHESGTSSTSSIPPASLDEPTKSHERQSLPSITTAPVLTSPEIDKSKRPQERLQQALSQFRADRKADGTEGRAPKNRQELLDQRRRKEEAKKAAKKEQRRREREEEARRQDEEIARRFSPGGSGSLLASPRSPITGDTTDTANNFTFGRIAFSDGTNFDPSTTEAVEARNKKGPRDAASQLQLAQAKKSRVAGLDDEKRTEIEQKDMWLNAKRRAHGERVRDDTSLLKKALKRQQGQKKKSEKEWNERLEGVRKAQDLRQKKRTENLAKRKEEKRGGGGKGKKVKRPGFEGSFKGRTGGGKTKS